MQDKRTPLQTQLLQLQMQYKKPAGRIVDTRTSQVNMDRYNEKYDRLASEKSKTDQTVNKQKLTQRKQPIQRKAKEFA